MIKVYTYIVMRNNSYAFFTFSFNAFILFCNSSKDLCNSLKSAFL